MRETTPSRPQPLSDAWSIWFICFNVTAAAASANNGGILTGKSCNHALLDAAAWCRKWRWLLPKSHRSAGPHLGF